MEYGLPKSLNIGGENFSIRYDYRVILDIFEALNDPELDEQEKALAVLQMFYLDFDDLEDYDEALKACFAFINGGRAESRQQKRPKLLDWNQDFCYIVAPVNRVIGYEVRGVDYDPSTNTGGLHWWTFLSAYMEIGECLFAQIVRIREKKASGKKLDKSDQEFYRKNRELVDIKMHYTDQENSLLEQWTGNR